MRIYEILNELNIEYDEVQHAPLYTVEEAQKAALQIVGVGCKNLFLTDKKGNYFLLILEESKRANMKEIKNILGVSSLIFASDEELREILSLERGSVTPLGIINDINHKVKIIIDHDLMNKKILAHPNTNTRTLSIHYNDLIRFIEYEGHEYILYDC